MKKQRNNGKFKQRFAQAVAAGIVIYGIYQLPRSVWRWLYDLAVDGVTRQILEK